MNMLVRERDSSQEYRQLSRRRGVRYVNLKWVPRRCAQIHTVKYVSTMKGEEVIQERTQQRSNEYVSAGKYRAVKLVKREKHVYYTEGVGGSA